MSVNLINQSNVRALLRNLQKRTSQEFLEQLNSEVARMVKRASRNATKKHKRSHHTVKAEDLRWEWA